MDAIKSEYKLAAKSIVGLEIEYLLEVKKKLEFLGIDIADILEFLDRDKVILFAEKERKIKELERKLEKTKIFIGEL